tara:strand:- start:225 stop:1283 length:1059 start_codon:yes stop_codon:yes gene_type:complete
MRNYNLKDVAKATAQNKFTAISLFSGVGGGCLGIKLAGGKILAVNEFIEEAQRVYKINFPDIPIIPNDIRELSGNDILEVAGIKKGELDLLAGSPPCSSFSSAGLRDEGWGKEKKYSDKKQRTDDLFYEFARVLTEIQPKYFIAENVKGLTEGASKSILGSAQIDMFGQHEDTIYHTLSKAGYKVQYKVLNSLDYGVPQSRNRLIIVGVRNDIDFTYKFPLPETRIYTTLEEAFKNVKNTPEDILEADISKYAVYQESLKLKPGSKSDKYFSLVKQSPKRYSDCLTQTAGTLSAASIVHWDNRKFTAKEAIEIMGFPTDIYLGETYSNKIERLGRAITPIIYQKAISQLIIQ